MAIGALADPNPYSPQMGTPPKSPEEFQGLHSKWMDYLTRPETMAALMQFGVSVLQPVNFGQSQAGNIGLAIADAGQAAGRVTAAKTAEEDRQQKIAQQAAENKQKERQIAVQEEGNVISREEIASREKISAEGIAAENARQEKSLANAIRVAQIYASGQGTSSDKLNGTLFIEAMKAYGEEKTLNPDIGSFEDYMKSRGLGGVWASIAWVTTPPPPTGGEGTGTPTPATPGASGPRPGDQTAPGVVRTTTPPTMEDSARGALRNGASPDSVRQLWLKQDGDPAKIEEIIKQETQKPNRFSGYTNKPKQ